MRRRVAGVLFSTTIYGESFMEKYDKIMQRALVKGQEETLNYERVDKFKSDRQGRT